MSVEEEKRKDDDGNGQLISGTFEFANLGDRRSPELVVEIVEPSGKRRQIKISADGKLRLDRALVGKQIRLEIRGTEEEGPVRQFRYDEFFEIMEREKKYVLPEGTWQKWFPIRTCVSGRVVVCRPIFPPLGWLSLENAVIASSSLSLREMMPRPTILETAELAGLFFPERCDSVCHGKVEVFLRTCCCDPIIIDPPIIIDEICKLIRCPEPWPPKPWPPDPWPPGPRPDPPPWLEQMTLRALKRSESVEGAPSKEETLRLSQHLNALIRLPREQQIAYIQAHHDLLYLYCHCTTTKVAEAPLQPDGQFDACWYTPFLVYPPNCTRRVLYRVSQFQGDEWVVIYDGLTSNQSFALNEDPTLRASWSAETCDSPPDPPAGMTPFVMLEQIGNTWADTLIHSTQQTGEIAYSGPLGAKDGLANEAPSTSVSVITGPYDQPWGKTLNLRFMFHPGLQGLGAKYYRVRVVRVGANGQPTAGGPNFVLTGGVSWRKYYQKPDGSVGVHWVSLNNPAIDGVQGLYTIPFPDLAWPWLGGQWHAFVVTDEQISNLPRMPNGRYLFVVDIFDANGKRLAPTNSLEPVGPNEIAKNFHYLHLDGPLDATYANTSIVPHSALANLFWVDNLAAYADIEQIVHSGTPSAQNCQFLEGPGTDTLQLEYSAYHNNGFQWYHRIRFKQGLTGPVTWLPASNSNVFSGLSQSRTFQQLLGTEAKCAFAANLYVYVRHTNGIGRIQAYDREDVAAFALEISP